MRTFNKALAVLLVFTMIFSSFAVLSYAKSADESVYSISEKGEHMFFTAVDKLIRAFGKVLNTVIPGLNWAGKIRSIKTYRSDAFFTGDENFRKEPSDGARWSMGFGEASFLEGIDVFDGSFYMAGNLEAFKGRVPKKLLDDQGVNAFVLSDGAKTIAYASIDGFGITRGDVKEIRTRLSDFAKENGIDSVNISAIHQHSCIDTLGLSAPLIPALLANPTMSLFNSEKLVRGKNARFMENVYNGCVKAIKTAAEGMQSGQLLYGSASIDDLLKDKREPRVVCRDIERLRFVPDNESANEIWVLNAGLHCITVGAGADELTADFPYYLEKNIKGKYKTDVVFVQGAELAVTFNSDDLEYDENSDTGLLEARGNALAERALSINNEENLKPLLNIAHREVYIPAENPVHIIAGREGLLDSVFLKDGFGYTVVTEIGYMELGGSVGAVFVPGELEPAILLGGAVSKEASWTGESWNFAPLTESAGVDHLLCFGLCNDQVGYILADNDYRSMLTENEEINALSSKSGSILTGAFESLFDSVQ